MGTLVHLDAPAVRLAAGLKDALGVAVSEAEARAALLAEIAYYREHMDEASDDARLQTLRGRCAAVLREALPPRAELAAATPKTMTTILLGALRFVAFPDARDALVRARRAGARVIVVSNWDISLAQVLEGVGLAPLLDGVLTSAAVGARKPAAEIFAAALALAGPGVEPARCLHVGDSASEDVAGARAAGMRAVLLDRGGAAPPPAGVPVIAGLNGLDPRLISCR